MHITIDTKKVKPSQRCPRCGTVHKEWAQLSNRYHICDDCGFEIPRDQGSAIVMWNVAADRQPGLGTGLVNCRCSSSTDSTRKHTGSMFAEHSVCVAFRRKGKQLGQMKRLLAQSFANEISKCGLC
ncbi:zinc ribbon domain-containing protein [Okeania sp. SIO3B5]|uniref:zinc ribbon domain-containing protein n=1 Tax=Okeania sp. SIO3B5 TaxID=2607811 RepID=UPI0035C8CAD9